MAAKEYGNNLSTAVTEKVVYEKTPTGNRKTVTLTCDWDNRATNTPALGSTSESMPLVSAGQEQLPGNIGRITLIYENTVIDVPSIPSTTYDEQTSSIELPIQQHPSFASWSADWDSEKDAFKPESDKYGVTSYIVGSTVVTKTEYFGSQPSSRYSDVGTLEVPGGGFGGSNQWLIIGTSRRKIGDGLYSRETQYLYSAKAYNTDIY